MDIYFSNFWLSCDTGFTKACDISVKYFEALQGIVKDYFCSDYYKIDFGTRGIDKLTVKHDTLKLLSITYFH